VVWGGVNNPKQSLLDLNAREIVTLAPFLLFVFWIGLGPEPFLAVMHSSVAHLLEQVGTIQASAVAGLLP